MAVVETIKIEGDASGAVSAFNKTTTAAKKTKDAAKESNKTIESGLGAIDRRTGGAVSAFKGLTGGIKKAAAGFKTLRGAVIATGIGALLIAITSLVAYFTKTEKGAQTLRVIMAALGQVLAKVMDVAVGIGESLVNAFSNPQKALKDFANLIKDNIINRFTGLMELLPALGEAITLVFSGKFGEAGKVATNAVAKVALGVEDVTGKVGDMVNGVKAFGTAIAESTMAAARLEGQMNAVKVAERQLTSERAKANKEIIKARLIADDITKSTEERSAAILEAGRLEQEVSDKELSTQRERLRILEAQAKLSTSDEATLDEIENARARVYDLEGANLSRRKRLQTEIIALKQEELAIEKEAEKVAAEKKKVEDDAAAEVEKKKKELYEKALDTLKTQEQREIDAVKTKYAELLLLDTLSIDQRISLQQMQSDELLSIEQKTADAQTAINNKRIADETAVQDAIHAARVGNLSNLQSTIGKLGSLFEEGTAASKTAAIAEIAIGTGVGFINGLDIAQKSAKAAGPGAAFAFPLFYASQIAAVLASASQAKKILSTAKGGGSVPSVSPPSITSPSQPPQFNVVGQGGVNQLAQSIGSQNNKPMRAYVVGGDVTTSQELERKRIKTATFG
jgi:hypothetical protein